MHRRLQDHQASPCHRSGLLAMALLSLLGLASCTPFATFPPLNDVEPLVPGIYPVPQVMGKALRTAYDKTAGTLQEGDEQPVLVFALPDGISVGNWGNVGIQTGVESARAITQADHENGVPFWSIEQVRVRNLQAEVDVIFPTSDDYQRATVLFESSPFNSFEVTFFQRWRTPVAVPPFTYPEGQQPESGNSEDDMAATPDAVPDDAGEEAQAPAASSDEPAPAES